jgi:hypothetical protein
MKILQSTYGKARRIFSEESKKNKIGVVQY